MTQNQTINFRANTDQLKADLTEATLISERFGKKLTSAFLNATTKGKGLSSTLKSLALDLSRLTLKQALRPLNQAIGSLISNVTPKIKPFANGGIINSPVMFPLNGNTGLAGEAGPEAILPLTRGTDGRLGIASSGNTPINITFNITTPNAETFRQSESQITAMLNKAVSRGTRNL